MSILVPLSDPDYLDRYAAAGADEFYAGFLDLEWSMAFGPHADINRMSGFGPVANCASFDELLFAAQLVADAGKRLYVPFNAPAYTARQLGYQRYYYKWLARYGARGVIVSQPEQVGMALEYGLEPVVSTLGAAYNELVVRRWASLGARRVILPRDLGLAEIEAIVRACPGLEYEAFLMRNGCRFSDAYCLGKHGGSGQGGLCAYLRRANKVVREAVPGAVDLGDAEATSRLYCERFHERACGLCGLWRLVQAGVTSFKVVGRSDDPEDMDWSIALAAHNLRLARSCASEAEYLARMERPADRATCDRGLNCYYPEARFGA